MLGNYLMSIDGLKRFKRLRTLKNLVILQDCGGEFMKTLLSSLLFCIVPNRIDDLYLSLSEEEKLKR